jgi:hypothetical protein
MTTPVLTLPLSKPAATPLKKKKVLLVDMSPAKRDLRAETMRKLGIDVDVAIDIREARTWWRADLYNLVLINMENELGHRDRFCEDIRSATPPQQLAFLVGKPAYLADSPNPDGAPSARLECDPALWGDVKAALSADVSGDAPQRWGILEACRRISAVRSLSEARSKAVRERPVPPRDFEVRPSHRDSAWSQVLPELQKEEMQ